MNLPSELKPHEVVKPIALLPNQQRRQNSIIKKQMLHDLKLTRFYNSMQFLETQSFHKNEVKPEVTLTLGIMRDPRCMGNLGVSPFLSGVNPHPCISKVNKLRWINQNQQYSNHISSIGEFALSSSLWTFNPNKVIKIPTNSYDDEINSNLIMSQHLDKSQSLDNNSNINVRDFNWSNASMSILDGNLSNFTNMSNEAVFENALWKQELDPVIELKL